MWTWLKKHRSIVASATSTVVITALVVSVAVISGGFTAQKVELNDASVWVVKGEDRVIGRANTTVFELNSVIAVDGEQLDVVQRGANVLLLDRTNSRVDIIDPATSRVLDGVPMPTAEPHMFLAGAFAAITDRDGRVWVLDSELVSDFDLESHPTLNLGAETVYSMDADGMLVAYSRAANLLYVIDVSDGGTVEETVELSFGTTASQLSVARVGSSWIVFDAVRHIAVIDGREVDLSGEFLPQARPALQASQPSASHALIAHPGGLIEVSLADGDVRTLVADRAGVPAVPIHLDGCRFAAWSDGTAWRQCAGSPPEEFTLQGFDGGVGELQFRTNLDRVVLNDPVGGSTWAVQASGELIDNWDELAPTQEDEDPVIVDDPDAEVEFERAQQPPVAVDDEFGARPGRATVLPVLLNDYDPNGDVLVIDAVTPIDESIGRLDLVAQRQKVQLSLAPNARGTFSFEYRISDGRGGSDSAIVTVTVRQPHENSPPRQVWPTTAHVAEGGRVSVNVLPDWVDPDGDPIYLVSAITPEPDAVSFTPDGTVVFREGGAGPRGRSVTLIATDGELEGIGTLSVTVSPPGDVPIVADPFVVVANAGEEIRVNPLEHVRGGTGVIRLSSVSSITGATITPNLERGTFRFRSETPRTFLLEYVVNDGTQSATGTVRIDVFPADDASAPITTPKTIFVRTLGSETLNLVASDVDPAGGVLIVTGVYNVPSGSGVSVELLEQESARVTLTAPLDGRTVSFNYRVSNGLAEAEGVVTVIEIPRPTRLQPPVAVSDTISVRVGAVVDIPVLANDFHPDGEELALERELASEPGQDSGLLFPSGNVLRFLAPDSPGNVTAAYTVSGPDGQTAQATVTITVRERVEETNRPPAPSTITARVLAGERVTIPIPLTGIDPDGDTVQFIGQDTNPEKGAVVAVDSASLTYEAGTYSAGTDTFRYTVIDALGARATGTIRVGISARLDGPRNPHAVADAVSMRPGGTVTVQVLANDSDPDGSPLRVVEVEANDPAVEVETDGTVVTVTPPQAEGSYGVIYTIQNELGGTSSAFLTITVDADAPRAHPQVADSVLTLTDILDRDEVDVDVLANAFFADGPARSLGVSLLPGYESGAVVTAHRSILVTIGDRQQIIPFAVTHPEDRTLVAYAFVWVPGYDDALPQVNRRAAPLTVASESTLRININDHVIAVGGAPVRISDTTTVQATRSNGAPLVVDSQTLEFTSADKYFGPASISFEVTDGLTADDPAGRKATIVLPITVTPRENQPPVFNGGVIQFEPAEEKTLDLVRLTTYPYPDDLDELAYTALAPLPVGFSYTLTGQQLVIRADPDAVKGSRTALVLGVRDDLTEGQSGRIELVVVPSSRPLAQLTPDSFIAPRGQTTTIDPLANDAAGNPFPGSPMTIVDVRGIDGSLPDGVSISPSADLRRLSVTVSPDAPAQDINVQYQVLDATRDPDRAVWGNVRIQIQDVPDPATGAVVTGFGDQRLTVAWSPGSFNNSPITSYEVTATRADTGAVVSTTTCTVTSGCDIATDGNGPAHGVRVTIVGINALGRSDIAQVPGTVWSDLLPGAPTGVSASPTNTAANGGSIAVTWNAVPAPAGGSAIVGYTIRITGPGVDLAPTVGPDATSFAYSNASGALKANTQYTITVYARNSAQVQSEAAWVRSASAVVTTVGPPSQVAGGVSAAVVNSQGHIRVTWGDSSPNGAASVTYSVGRLPADATLPSTCQTPTPGSGGPVASGWVDTGVADQATYRYAVYADNGYYCTLTASGPVLTMLPPGQASASVSLQPRPGEPAPGQYDILVENLTVASLTAAKFQVSVNGGAWRDVTAGSWLTSLSDSSVYGNSQSMQFRGCRDLTDAFCGTPSGTITLTPVNARASSILTCVVGSEARANPPANAGNPPVSYLWSFGIGDTPAEWSAYSADATVPTPPDPDTPVRARVKAVVTISGLEWTDPGHLSGACSP